MASRVVAPLSADADKGAKLGREAVSRLTRENYANVKLKRGDKVVSLSASFYSAIVRAYEVEIDLNLLFMRVTCVIKGPTEIAENLRYAFSTQPPALFDKCTMRKTTKGVMANQLKVSVAPSPCNTIQDPYYLVDGGELLRSV